MGKSTVCAYLDPATILFPVLRFSGTMFSVIQRAVTKQAVKIRKSLVTGKIFATPVFKKAV